MAQLQIQTKLSVDDLIKAINQLNKPELENFVRQMLVLQAQRKAPNLSKREAELLDKVNHAISPEVQKRYDWLIERRKAEKLTSDEYSELLKLTDIVEKLEAKRVKYLAELAQVRRITLSQLTEQLGIKPPKNA
jgi:hypothetical protein